MLSLYENSLLITFLLFRIRILFRIDYGKREKLIRAHRNAPLIFSRTCWRQKIFAGYYALTGFLLQFKTSSFSYLSAFFTGFGILNYTGCVNALGNLPCGKLRKGAENKLRFAHVVSKILSFKPFDFFVFFNRNIAPLPVNNIGENGIFVFTFYFMIFPVIGKFIAGFLPHHSLLILLFAYAMLFPVFPCSVKRSGRITHILDAFVADFGEPKLDGFSFGAGHRLNKP